MRIMRRLSTLKAIALACGVAAALLTGFAGCAELSQARAPTESDSAGEDEEEFVADNPSHDLAGLSGSQLWEQSCARCHYMRPPRWYSDSEWDVAMFHMRVQLNLTADEQKKILKYLQAAN
jgi:hypothetical protein